MEEYLTPEKLLRMTPDEKEMYQLCLANAYINVEYTKADTEKKDISSCLSLKVDIDRSNINWDDILYPPQQFPLSADSGITDPVPKSLSSDFGITDPVPKSLSSDSGIRDPVPEPLPLEDINIDDILYPPQQFPLSAGGNGITDPVQEPSIDSGITDPVPKPFSSIDNGITDPVQEPSSIDCILWSPLPLILYFPIEFHISSILWSPSIIFLPIECHISACGGTQEMEH